jgi:hypothetical protein
MSFVRHDFAKTPTLAHALEVAKSLLVESLESRVEHILRRL